MTITEFEKNHWSTGQSSPWLDKVHITKINKINDKKVKITITYNLISSYKNFGSGKKIITLEKNPQTSMRTWFITHIETKYNPYEGFTPAETIIK